MTTFVEPKSQIARKYTANQMIIWCLKNITDFDININDGGLDLLGTTYLSRNGFSLDVTNQTIIYDTNYILIRCNDETIPPFTFRSDFGWMFRCPNLKTLNCLFAHDNSNAEIYFINNNNLDYSQINLTLLRNVNFENVNNINPLSLQYNTFNTLYFDCYDNNSLYDFDNYQNINICLLQFIARGKLKNLTSIITNENTLIYKFTLLQDGDAYYAHPQNMKLNMIVNTFLSISTNREDYAMDMTVALLEAGFEDEV